MVGASQPDDIMDEWLSECDIVIVHDCSGTDTALQQQALRLASSTTVFVLFPPDDPPDIEGLLAGGVVAAHPWSVPVHELVAVLWGQTETDPADDLASVDEASMPALSRREGEVLHMIARGLTHQQVARRLQISVHTVDTYVRRIKFKWKLGNKADLTRAALRVVPSLTDLVRPAPEPPRSSWSRLRPAG
jgi:DNA-binding NarL/FixJ family response regulator